MSADNWSTCPECVKRAKGFREAFREKYYGKLDSFVFIKIFEEIQKAVEHIESYSSNKHKPDRDIIVLAEDRHISLQYCGQEYKPHEILQDGQISSSLREDYEQGIDDNGLIHISYSCYCECGFGKSFVYHEPKESEKEQ